MRALVVGGARSGKSTWAEGRFADCPQVDYVATSVDDGSDPEWGERVRRHRSRRPATWRTVETLDLAGVLAAPGSPVLIDCLAVWLARVLDEVDAWQAPETVWRPRLEARVTAFVDALDATERDVVVVSNEVGSGVVPATVSGRLYRDELGQLNARVAAVCDELWVTVAGVARQWK